MAGTLPRRRSSGTCGSAECSAPPAADARSAATAEGRGFPSPTATSATHRPAARGSLLHRRQSAEPLGLGRLRNLDPKPPVQRCERERPGDLIHIDVKKLARFRKVGHRITGNRQQGRSAGVGYDRVHVAIDDATRLAYVEVLPD